MRLQSMVRHVVDTEIGRGYPPPDIPLHRPTDLRRAGGIEYATYATDQE